MRWISAPEEVGMAILRLPRALQPVPPLARRQQELLSAS